MKTTRQVLIALALITLALASTGCNAHPENWTFDTMMYDTTIDVTRIDAQTISVYDSYSERLHYVAYEPAQHVSIIVHEMEERGYHVTQSAVNDLNTFRYADRARYADR